MVAAFEKDDQHSATQRKCRQTSSLTPLSETQHDVVEVCSYGVGHVEVRCQPREEPFGDITNFHARFLQSQVRTSSARSAEIAQTSSGMPFARSIAAREDAISGDQLVHRFLDRVTDSFDDIDVEAGTADDLAGLVDQRSPTTTTQRVVPLVSTMRCRQLNEPPEVRITSNVSAT